MDVLAAVARSAREPLRIECLQLEEPRAEEILVRVVATGVCHTDIVVRDQLLPTPLPAVLGHEGSGIVERVGDSVRSVRPGDRVVMTFNSCGHCDSCDDKEPAYCHEFFPRNFFGTREDGSSGLSQAGALVHGNFFGQSSFASLALCHERNVVKVPDDLPLRMLGPLACGIQTGAGAVINALKLKSGQSIVIFGVGSVGLAAVLAARALGAAQIVAVDLNESRLHMARSLGATATFHGKSDELAKQLESVTGIGMNCALDTTGLATVIKTAVQSLAPRGTCGILGASPLGSELVLDEVHFMSGGRKLIGIVEGSSVPQEFIPRLIELYKAGRFPFDKLLSYYPFRDINQAIHDSESGKAIKAIVEMESSVA